MNVRATAVAAIVALAGLPACNSPSCGAGTKQQQQMDGTLKCVPVDATASSIGCNVDAGAVILGGTCVSAVTCGPNTMLVNGQCVGTGMGGGVPSCSKPSSGHFCVNGALVTFLDSTASPDEVSVAVYDPITLLSNGAPLDKGVFTGGYVFPNIPAPGLGLIAIVVGDPDGLGQNVKFVNCASGDQTISNGNSYRVDAYVLPRSVADGWKPSFDFAPSGGYVGKFFDDPLPPATALIANETHPTMGVQLTENGAVAAGVKYFGASLLTIDGSLTATSAAGAAIVAAPVTGSFPSFSGMGGGITWDSQPGGSAAGVVFVTRFHPKM